MYKRQAHLVLNLSHPDKWVETFGLTVLEAMCYALPVIVPPVGGVVELVDDGVTGFKIDVRDTLLLDQTINKIRTNPHLYYELSKKSFARSLNFQNESLMNQVEDFCVN